MQYETVIGLEIHAQLLTRSKIFCSCQAVFGSKPNTNGCPVCLGMPGSLPVLNRSVVEMAILMACAVGAQVAPKSVFARKNYVYPDLPKGYQISQFDLPLCSNGHLDIEVEGVAKKIGITRIHLEEDAGKLVHDLDTASLFDVNRCGTPLIEIVSEPDMRSPAEAYAYLSSIKRILEYLGICDCNMEEGSLRCDANVSIRPLGTTKLGTRTELKNMNSFRNVEKAIAYEVARQTDILENGGAVVQQTFLWDADKSCTIAMRSKENADDYRYFPDPDLVPLLIHEHEVEVIKNKMPELPQTRCSRFVTAYGLTLEHAAVLTDSRDVADYYESVIKEGADPRTAATWVLVTVLKCAKDKKCLVSDLTLTPLRLAQIVSLMVANTISASAAKIVAETVESTGKEPNDIVAEQGLGQISDTIALETAVRQVIDANPAEVTRFKGGDSKLMSFFMGQTMKVMKGKGNPKEISAILARLLA